MEKHKQINAINAIKAGKENLMERTLAEYLAQESCIRALRAENGELIEAIETISAQLKLMENNQRIITRDMYLILDKALLLVEGRQ